MRKYYSLVVSVLDEDENRVDAHEITGCNNKRDILKDRAKLEKEIETGKYAHVNAEGCTLAADIEVHDDDTYDLLEII